MIKLIGTHHLMSREAIEGFIRDENPDFLGVEVDETRANIMLNEQKTQTNGGTLLDKITNKIKKKAEEKNLDYGGDMKSVLNYAKENNIKCFYVDMPILKIQELFNKIPPIEQKGFQEELIVFENVELELEVDAEIVLSHLKEKFPIAFEFLVNMRNLYIANQILKIERPYPNKKILIFLGKSHIKQVEKMIN